MTTKIYKVDSWNNFCRVFKCPKIYSSDFCYTGGIPTTFMMVDWFNPVSHKYLFTPGISKEDWIKRYKVTREDLQVDVNADVLEEQLIQFIENKNYIKPYNKYIIICDFGFTFSFET